MNPEHISTILEREIKKMTQSIGGDTKVSKTYLKMCQNQNGGKNDIEKTSCVSTRE